MKEKIISLCTIKNHKVFFAFCIINICFVVLHILGNRSAELYMFVSIITSGLLGYVIGYLIGGIKK